MTRLRAIVTPEFWSHFAPWMVIAYVAVVFLGSAAYVVNARTLRDEAVRVAETRAAKDAAVARCLSSRPQLQRVSKHVRGVNEFAVTVVENSARVLDATPRSDPQYQVRRTNLISLIKAREKIKAVSGFHVPTVADCHQLGR